MFIEDNWVLHSLDNYNSGATWRRIDEVSKTGFIEDNICRKPVIIRFVATENFKTLPVYEKTLRRLQKRPLLCSMSSCARGFTRIIGELLHVFE